MWPRLEARRNVGPTLKRGGRKKGLVVAAPNRTQQCLLRWLLSDLVCLHTNVADLARRRSYYALACRLAALLAGEMRHGKYSRRSSFQL
jgi:hypothetical protein